jgi:hypothetical protein
MLLPSPTNKMAYHRRPRPIGANSVRSRLLGFDPHPRCRTRRFGLENGRKRLVNQTLFLTRIRDMPEKTPEQNVDSGRKDAGAPSQPKVPVVAEKVADKPHRITIGLQIFGTVLGALIALLGIWLTYRGHQSDERNKSQEMQPYVAVTGGKLDFIPLVAGPVPQADITPGTIVNPEPAGPFLGTDLSVTIENKGKTSAEFISFKASFDPLPEGWSLRKRLLMPEEKPSYLGPQSQVVWHYHQPFNLTPEAWTLFHKGFKGAGVLQFLNFSGELVYRDEYKKEHTTRWCWRTFADATNNGQVEPCPFH